MAFFRNLDKVVPSSLFSRPNSFYLQSRFRPIYLTASYEPSIEHLHSVRALLTTIRTLERHASEANYQQLVKSELDYLHRQTDRYADAITRFVSQGGLLTGEGIANLYYAAQTFNLSPEWLDRYVHNDIPHKYRWMSRQNLLDVVTGLEKYHKNSPYLAAVKQELASRPAETPTFVTHQFNQSNKYEYAEDNPSNNVLI